MSNPPKYFEQGATHFISSRTEEGLPFFPKRRFRRIAKAILARAQELYPVELICFDLGENQIHMLLTVKDPANAFLFIGYVKQELAHAVNRIRGKKKKTLWCDGYDSPALIRPEEIFYYIAYCYLQAQTAHQADCIEQSDHASSWPQFISSNFEETHKRLFRTDYENNIDEDDTRLADRKEHKLILTPYAWLKKVAPQMSEAQAKEAIIKQLRAEEARLREERKQQGIPIRNTPPSPEYMEKYVPKKRGKRTVCVCWDVEMRKGYLTGYNEKRRQCREVYAMWRVGDYSQPWPAGFFPPGLPPRPADIPL